MNRAEALAAVPGPSAFQALLDAPDALLEALPTATCVCAADGSIVRFNRKAAELWGGAPKPGEPQESGPPGILDLSGRGEPAIAEVLRTGEPIRGRDIAVERPDGSRILCRVTIEPLKNAAGRVEGMVACFEDVTARRQAETALEGELAQRRRTEEELGARSEQQTALYEFTDRLQAATSLREVYEAALDAISRALHCDRASILLFDADGVMRFVASRGLSERYRRAVEGHTPWTRETANPQPIAIADISETGEPESIKAAVREEGIAGLAFVPLTARGRVIGKFMTYYDRAHAFGGGDIELALTIARQIGLNLERVRAETERRATEEALRRQSELLQTIIDRIPVMVAIYEPRGKLLQLNPEFRRVIGWSAGDLPPNGSLMEAIYPDPDYRAQIVEFMSACRDGWMDMDMRARDGRTLQTSWANIRLSGGVQVGIGLDITERAKAEALQKSLLTDSQRLAAIVESSDDAIVSKDLNGVIVSWNRGAERLFGYTADEAVGRSITMLMPPDRVSEEPGILERIRRGERVDHFETVRQRKDGALLDISLTISPVKDGSGRIVGASKIARDITAQKRMEEQRDLLIAELSHRVKNTLAIVLSIAQQSFANPDVPEARRSFESRIRGLAQTHSRLAEANWSGVSVEMLLKDELAPYRQENGDNVKISGPCVVLNSRAALMLGMALHELATNAAKYGALSCKAGQVHVSWRIDRGMLHLDWIESGGPPVMAPSRSGFGRLLIERALASDLRGEARMEFAPQGLHCAISVPLQDNSGG